jgi:hypothetical protein
VKLVIMQLSPAVTTLPNKISRNSSVETIEMNEKLHLG